MSKNSSKTPGEDEEKGEAASSAASSESSSAEKRPHFVNEIESIDNIVGFVEHAFLAFSLFSLIGVGSYQFFASRLFHINETWPFEALRYLVFFCAMGGAALAAHKGRMISMDFVARKLAPRKRIILRIGIACFVVFNCYLLYTGSMHVRDAVAGEEYEVLKPSTAILVLPAGAALIAFHYILHAITDALYLAAGQIPPEEEGPQAH